MTSCERNMPTRVLSAAVAPAALPCGLKNFPMTFPSVQRSMRISAKVLNQNEKVEVTLKLISPAPIGWLDRLLGVPVQPINFTLDMPDIPGDRVARGELVRLRTAGARL